MDYNHPELAPTANGPYDLKILPGTDLVNGDENAQDDNGHGTMICGIVGARTNNGAGIASIGWNARLIPVKVLDQDGVGSSLNTANGIMYAVQTFLKAKAKVDPISGEPSIFSNPFNARLIINMSYTYEVANALGPSQMELTAVNYAIGQGALLVAAAGDGARPLNDGNTTIYPASFPGVVAVGATDHVNSLMPDSNTLPLTADPNTSAFFVAPGADILSTSLTSYSGRLCGRLRHFVCWRAMASGVATLIWEKFPFLTPSEVIDTLVKGANADIIGGLGADHVSGHGLINALNSLQTTFTPNPTNEPVIGASIHESDPSR